MEFAGDLRLLEIFMEHAAERDEERRISAEALVLDQDHRKKQTVQEKRERREKDEQRERDDAMLATMAQRDAFKAQLDDYDTATVEALMDNGRALDAVRHAREEIEASAYRLPDGRMVFKSDDGKQVFDQHGGEVSRDLIDPNAIPDTLARKSAYDRIVNSEDKLTGERRYMHHFQERLDAARDAANRGDVSVDALSKMREALRRDVPKAISARMGVNAPEHARSPVESGAVPATQPVAGLDDPSRFAGLRPAPMPH